MCVGAGCCKTAGTRGAPGAGWVVPVHAPEFWARALAPGGPATPAAAEYGTPDLAGAIGELARRLGTEAGLLVLPGHKAGLPAYGPDIPGAHAPPLPPPTHI